MVSDKVNMLMLSLLFFALTLMDVQCFQQQHRNAIRQHPTQQHHSSNQPNVDDNSSSSLQDVFELSTRRQLLQNTIKTIVAGTTIYATATTPNSAAIAAPPIAVIAEELGYFPVQNKNGDVMYIPKRVQRISTPQAIQLATLMREKGIMMYGAYWCPHCSNQKEMFGNEAFSKLEYIECSPKGYGYNPKLCQSIDAYPTFKDKRGKVINVSGEQSLEALAKQIGYSDFDPSLEDSIPMVGTTCKLPKR